jgi:hypothetical protein
MVYGEKGRGGSGIMKLTAVKCTPKASHSRCGIGGAELQKASYLMYLMFLP